MAWFREGGSVDPDDAPTGQIAAIDLSRIIEEADGTTGGRPTSETDVHPLQQAPVDTDRALADRKALIKMCLYALDRARSGGVVERLEAGLAAVGVRALRPDGERFDPAHHEAGAVVPTDDPELVGIVAETEVTGFADHDELLRAPIVTVYAARKPS